MSTPKFVSATTINTKFAERNRQQMDAAIDTINKVINEAKECPILVPVVLLTEFDAVRNELLRMLREIAGWRVEPITVGDSAASSSVVTHYALRYPSR